MNRIPQVAIGGNALGLPAARHRHPDPAEYPTRWITRRFRVSPAVARVVCEAHFGEPRP